MSATGKPKNRTAPSGFTLIEMLVTLAVLGLVTGLAFPAVDKALSGQRLRLATSDVLAGLALARSTAVRTTTTASFAIGRDANHFIASGAPESRLPEAALLSLSTPKLRFYADGTADGGQAQLQIGARTRTIVIDPLSGMAEARP